MEFTLQRVGEASFRKLKLELQTSGIFRRLVVKPAQKRLRHVNLRQLKLVASLKFGFWILKFLNS
ncbi:MAG: hypothetical protein AB1705_11845 [Verrucomicrobiota bacterium]